MTKGCIFCAIVAGDAPAEVIYEDAATVAFLDIVQATDGHALVVPRDHYPDLFDLPPDVAAALMRAAQNVACILRAALDVDGVNIVNASGAVAWQSVEHVHFHVIPRYRIDDLTPPWDIGRAPVARERLTETAERIRAAALG